MIIKFLLQLDDIEQQTHKANGIYAGKKVCVSYNIAKFNNG